MAENAWLLNDSAPVPVGQEFSPAAPAKAWGWFGLPAAGEGSEFEVAAIPSVATPWTPAELAFNGAEAGGGTNYNESVTESLSLADTQTAVAAFLSSLTESLATADSQSATAQFASALAESLATAD